ncbi:WG repeat-containing protein [Moraxella sp. ZJ142]|uniref:WG repeat-containing protein n=1 Tax=Moraxella marmotae TaxID=3344520 RepID=UPI0035D4A360
MIIQSIAKINYGLKIILLAMLSINISNAYADDETYASVACIKPKTEQHFDHVGCLNKKGIAIVGDNMQTVFGDLPYPMGLVDKSGKLILLNQYHHIYMPSDWEYDNSLPMSDALILVETRELSQDEMFGNIDVVSDAWGLVNAKGEFIVPIGVYDKINKFYDNGLASVKSNDKYGFVNTKGELVIPLMYDYAFGFSNGFADVQYQGFYGVIDVNNKTIVDFNYQHIQSLNPNLFAVKNKDRYALMDIHSTLLTGYDYDMIMDLDYKSLYRVEQSNKYGVINAKGEIIVPVMYDYVDIDYQQSSYQNEKTYLSASIDDRYDVYDEQGVLIDK